MPASLCTSTASKEAQFICEACEDAKLIWGCLCWLLEFTELLLEDLSLAKPWLTAVLHPPNLSNNISFGKNHQVTCKYSRAKELHVLLLTKVSMSSLKILQKDKKACSIKLQTVVVKTCSKQKLINTDVKISSSKGVFYRRWNVSSENNPKTHMLHTKLLPKFLRWMETCLYPTTWHVSEVTAALSAKGYLIWNSRPSQIGAWVLLKFSVNITLLAAIKDATVIPGQSLLTQI